MELDKISSLFIQGVGVVAGLGALWLAYRKYVEDRAEKEREKLERASRNAQRPPLLAESTQVIARLNLLPLFVSGGCDIALNIANNSAHGVFIERATLWISRVGGEILELTLKLAWQMDKIDQKSVTGLYMRVRDLIRTEGWDWPGTYGISASVLCILAPNESLETCTPRYRVHLSDGAFDLNELRK